jgi:hypothetical protein
LIQTYNNTYITINEKYKKNNNSNRTITYLDDAPVFVLGRIDTHPETRIQAGSRCQIQAGVIE